MKIITSILPIMAILLSLTFGSVGHATGKGITVLNDREMAAVKGGFCILEQCEDAPGTATCQPYPVDEETLCKLAVCLFEHVIIGNLDQIGCIGWAPSTCTESTTYRQCVMAFKLSTCSSGSTTPCGKHVSADCIPSIPDRGCLCHILPPDRDCDWTNCTP